MMNTIFALSMVAGVGLTTGTPVIGARVAEEMWAAGTNTDHGLVTWRYVAYNGGKSRWGGVYCPPPQVPRSRSVRRASRKKLEFMQSA